MAHRNITVTITARTNAREIASAGLTEEEIREGLKRAVKERADQYLGDGGEVTEVK